MSTFDPKMLLNPKAAAKQASAPPSRPPANSFQVQDQQSFSADNTPAPSNNGLPHRSADQGSLYDKLYNVERRDESAPRKRKMNDGRSQEQNNDEEREVKVKKLTPQSRTGGGELGQYLKEERRKVQDQQGSTAADVVDLTEDKDDETEVLYVKDNLDREVCAGKIDGARVNAHRVPAISKSGFSSNMNFKMWPPQKVQLTRRPGPNTAIIGVVDSAGKDFGTIDVKTASALAPIMDSLKKGKEPQIRVLSRLDQRAKKPWEMPGQAISEHYAVTLVIYCPFRMVKGIGQLFGQRQIWLRDPQSIIPGVELCNPHAPKDHRPTQRAIAATTSRYSGTAQVQRTQEEVRRDVFQIFDTLKQSDALPQAEQPAMITTPLLGHQRQALHFMKEREKDKRQEDDNEDESSLWRPSETRKGTVWYHVITGHETPEEPEPVLGGILADVMGLGKTLNVLSLICESRQQAVDFGTDTPPKPKFDGDRQDLRFNSRATLLVCPLSTISNWEDQIKQHISKTGNTKFRYLIHHGPNRSNDVEEFTDYDLVITSYSVVYNDSLKRSASRPNDPLGETHWFRIVLDEAHTIREQATKQSKATCALSAQRRWAVTGTPVQNRLEDLGALMKFLRIRPFDEFKNFAQYIITPFKTADTEIIPKLRLLVDSITLRRGKDKINLPKREEVLEKLAMSDQDRELHQCFAVESRKNVEAMMQKQKLGGKGYAHVLKAITRLRLLCAGGSDLLSDEDWSAAQGFSSNTAIDLEEVDGKPDRTQRQALEFYKMMKDADMNACSKCSRIIQHKEFQDDRSDDDEGSSEEHENHTFGYLAMCNQLICTHCIGEFKQQCDTVDGGDGFGTCPLCETYTKFAFNELTQDEFDSDEAETREVRNNPTLARRMGRYSGPSTKTQALVKALEFDREASEALVAKGEKPIKSVIFSGWTSHLDLIQLGLSGSKIHYVRLDGSMSRKQRSLVLDAFSTNDEVTCILVSITAGGLGLNLTAASRVFVMEPQYNPASEAQAIERVHRLGQKRDVIITKYVMEKSFEEKMLALQAKKIALAEMSIEGRKYDKQEKAREKMEDLKTLFR